MLIASLTVASTWSVFSHTWDEPEHLAAGLSLLDRFRYQYDIQHPPLARLAMAVGPYLLGARSVGLPPPDGRPEGVAILYVGEDLDVLLELCDRILVLCGGRVTGIVDARTATKEDLGLMMTGLAAHGEATA